MNLGRLTLGCAALACVAGCTSDPNDVNKTMNFLGTAAAAVLEATQPPPPPPPPPTVVVQQPVVVAQPVVAQPVVVQQPVVQQPVVQQPVVQQPAVQPPVVQAPAVQQPAAPALDTSAFASAVTTATDTAVPEYKYGALNFEKPATPAQINEAKEKMASMNVRLDQLRITFDKVDDATIAATLVQFPEATSVMVNHSDVKSIAPFALLRNATRIGLKNIKGLDLKPLAGLTKLTSLDLTYSEVADLSPLAALPELKDITFYGATVTSFAPLAACPKLQRVYFYAAVTSKEGYDSLGTLKQVTQFHGGLTKMTSIAWLRQVPQAQEVKLFAEKIEDYSPISSLPNLTYLRLWNQNGGNLSTAVGDLQFLAPCTKLQTLELPSCKFTNTAVLAGLPELKNVDLSDAKAPVSIAFATKLPKLTRLNLSRTTVTDGAVAASLPKTVRVITDKKTQGVPASNP